MLRFLDKPSPWAIPNLILGAPMWLAFVLLSIWNHGLANSTVKPLDDILERDRDKLWDLSRSWGRFTHNFVNLSSLLRVHYVSNYEPSSVQASTNHLFIFIHGFPDSWALWRYILSSSLSETATLVALDLPGYGGSDSMPVYGATELLEALAGFIMEIRRLYGFEKARHGKQKRQVVIVAHDWGCLLASRLATEAPELADRFVLSNAPVPQLCRSNVENILCSASSQFQTFLWQPITKRNYILASLSTLFPLVQQIWRLGYVFAFHLPSTFVRILGTTGHFGFIKFIHDVAIGNSKAVPVGYSSEALASSLGPGPKQSMSTIRSTLQYPISVQRRAHTSGEVFVQTTAYYRHGALFDKWIKSPRLATWLSGTKEESTLHDPSPSQAEEKRWSRPGIIPLGQKATVIWGQADYALLQQTTLNGIERILQEGSHLILLPNTGHFTPIEENGRKVFQAVLEWLERGEDENLVEIVQTLHPDSVVKVITGDGKS